MYEYDGGGSLFAVIPLLLMVVAYLYCGFCQFTMAKKVGHNSPWWAFVPILNLFQVIQMASKEWWWFLLFFVPIINIVAWVMVWIGVAEARNKPAVWGVFMLIPFLNFVSYAVLAAGPAFAGVTDKAYAKKSDQERVGVN